MYLLITTCTIVCERVLGLRQLLERNEFGRSSFPDISRFKVQSSNSFVYLCAAGVVLVAAILRFSI